MSRDQARRRALRRTAPVAALLAMLAASGLGLPASAARPVPAVAKAPAPIQQPSASRPLVLLKIGDSLGEELGFGLRDVVGSYPYVHVLQEAVGDSGLARPDFYNWPVHLAAELRQFHPAAVVVLLGGDDGQDFVDRGRIVHFGTALWRSVYSSRVAQMMDEATAAGARVLWVGLPIMSSPVLSAEMVQMNTIYAHEAALHAGVTFLATWRLFATAQGAYSAYLPDASGQTVLMRNPDGVHFSGAGDDRLATAVVRAMDRSWHIRIP